MLSYTTSYKLVTKHCSFQNSNQISAWSILEWNSRVFPSVACWRIPPTRGWTLGSAWRHTAERSRRSISLGWVGDVGMTSTGRSIVAKQQVTTRSRSSVYVGRSRGRWLRHVVVVCVTVHHNFKPQTFATDQFKCCKTRYHSVFFANISTFLQNPRILSIFLLLLCFLLYFYNQESR